MKNAAKPNGFVRLRRRDGVSVEQSRVPLSANSISLAGEFATLSRLALWGYDANMTLGRTKNVDILVSDPRTNKFYQVEVKTSLDRGRGSRNSQLFGRYEFEWVMNVKHESISRPQLWYCFVSIGLANKTARFFVVPSAVVAKYVRKEHALWLHSKKSHRDNPIRVFRLGLQNEHYKIAMPLAATYEDNWGFAKRRG